LFVSKYRTSVKHVGDTEVPLHIELIQVTTPHGIVPTVLVKHDNGIQYASVPLAHLPQDIQDMFS
jgi:hypothetical protein